MGTRLRTFDGTVLAEQCDEMGHLHTSQYHFFFSKGLWRTLHIIGYDVPEFVARGIGFVEARHVIEYRHEIFAGQRVYVMSEIGRVGTKSLTTRHLLYNFDSGELSAELEAVTVQYDLNKRCSITLLDDIKGLAMNFGVLDS